VPAEHGGTASAAVIVQARMGSSRLPGKVLRRVAGRSLIEHLLRRVRRADTVAQVCVATTTEPSDDALVGACEALGVPVHRGPVDDVLTRFLGAADALGDPELLVRVTGDCPLLDPAEIDRLVRRFVALRASAEPVDYLTNQAGLQRTIPFGYDVEVFTARALRESAARTTDPGDREHVTPYLYRSGAYRSAVEAPPGPDRSHLRLTVDTPDDLALVTAVVEALGEDAEVAAIDAWLAAHPEVAALNRAVRHRDARDEQSQRRARVAGRTLLARADAGPGLGFGHVARVEAILDAWTELGGRALLRGRGVQGGFRARIEAAGVALVDVLPLDPPHPGPPETFPAAGLDDAEATLDLAREEHACALLCDGYAFGPEYLARLADTLPLLYVDDLAAAPLPADVVLNSAVDFDPSRYALDSTATLLVGAAYIPLRAELRRAIAAPTLAAPAAAPSAPARVVLTFGAADFGGLSLPVARALLDATARREGPVAIEVIVGPAAPEAARAELLTLAAAEANLRVATDVVSMAEAVAGATCVVTAAGSTTWELLALGVPVVAAAVAENQRHIAEATRRRGVVAPLDPAAPSLAEALAAAALGLLDDPARRAALGRAGRALVDGKGVWRIIDALLDAVARREDSATTTHSAAPQQPGVP
jgi:spore coat polysaccharide biosynthesis protein SpsF